MTTKLSEFIKPACFRSTCNDSEQRRASWMELFYDLVYMVAIAASAEFLFSATSLLVWGQFILLFAALWAAWTAMTFYATRFDTDDPFHRLMFLTQMICIVFYAVFAKSAFKEASQAFAVSYSTLCVLIISLYVRIRIVLPETRLIVDKLLRGLCLSTLFWIASIFVPTTYRFYCWIIAICIYFITPSSLKKTLEKTHQNLSASHLPERFGLFTILVLGEAIASVVYGIRIHGITQISFLTALFSLLIAFGIWWLYFENMEVDISELPFMRTIYWEFCHLVLVMSITALSVAVHHALLTETTLSFLNALLLGFSISSSLLMITFLNYIRCGKSPWLSLLFVSIAFVAGIGSYFIPADISLGILMLIMLTEVLRL